MKRLLALAVLGGAPLTAQFSNGYTFKRAITVNNGVATAPQNDFPMAFSEINANFATTGNGGNVQHTCAQPTISISAPCDFIFTSDAAGTTLLNWEVEKYGAATGQVVAHVRWPSSHPAQEGAVIYLWYGNPSVSTWQGGDIRTVWDSGYRVVMHLGDGSTLSAGDSTGNGNGGTTTTATAAAGRIGGGAGFAGTAGNIISGPDTNFPLWGAASLLEMWINLASLPPDYTIATPFEYGVRDWGKWYGFNIEGRPPQTCYHKWMFSQYGGNFCSNSAVATGSWHYVALRYLGGVEPAGNFEIYIDGVLDNAGPLTSGVMDTNPRGAYQINNGEDGAQLAGSIDELRFSYGSRSADYIAAAYASGSHSFYTLGGPSTAGAGPTISNVTAAANSASSILVSWTTSAVADSQVLCGAQSGVYTYATPVVNPVHAGGDPYWGVTSHSVAITGLPTNTNATAYYCVAKSTGVTGTTSTSAEVTSGTTAPLLTTPFTVADVSPATRINDASDGSRGMPATGFWFDGGNAFRTWGEDGSIYGVCSDCGGVANSHDNGIAWMKWDSDLRSAAMLSPDGAWGAKNEGTAGPCSGSSRWSINGISSIRGTIYLPVTCSTSDSYRLFLLKSLDRLSTTIAPEHNSGPEASGTGASDLPSSLSGYTALGQAAVQTWIDQHCQDHSVNCIWVAGADGWIYLRSQGGANLAYFYLYRCRIENMAVVEVFNTCQAYAGTQDGDDGLYDSNWTSTLADAHAFQRSEYGLLPQVAFLPGFNRFISAGMVPAQNNPAAITSTLICDLGPYPWGHCTPAGYIPRESWAPNYNPSYPQIALWTYQTVSSSPLSARVMLMAGGSSLQATGSTAATDEASPRVYTLTLAARAQEPSRPAISSNSRIAHIASGLELFYDFRGLSNATTVADRSPSGAFAASVPYPAGDATAAPISYDRTGMINFGFPIGNGNTNPQDFTVTTPYVETLASSSGAFTATIVFAHDPAGLQPAVNNEIVLSKGSASAYDFAIQRRGGAAGWDVIVSGTTVTSQPLACDDRAYCAFIVRRDAAGETSVFRSGSIQSSLPLTADGAAVATGGWSANPLTLGSGLYGVIAEALLWNRALADAELVREANVVRLDMAARGVQAQ